MKIILENTGKKYNREWIFRGINLELTTADSYVVSGGNGSGKSTFLKLISGFQTQSEGVIAYHQSDSKDLIPVSQIYKEVAYSAPYIAVFEEYTIQELVSFAAKLKPLKNNIDYQEFLEIIELQHASNKPIKNFSSGMKQRVKLGLSILMDTSILLLDEPTSNLDKNAIKWYQNLVGNHIENRIVIVASNDQKDESFFCNKEIKIEAYKS